MTEVISVKFKSRGKMYYFAPNGIEVRGGEQVVVETSKGLELADCVHGNHWVEDTRIVPPLRPVVRAATGDDRRVAELCKAREREAFKICEEKIAKHGLDMKLVDVECNFEGNKILFFFISEGRVDFRDLVKDLAGVFRTRIELRQIGVRDEAKMLGGLGICGRPFCCHQFLDDFQPVSTKMAKTQSLSLNPTKISGTCGRLMCCLRYEQEAYEELSKTVPKTGAFVETPDGYGSVAQVSLLRRKVKVKLDGDDEQSLRNYDADDVAAIPGGRPRPGEPLPHVLRPRPRRVEEDEKPTDLSFLPMMLGEEPGPDGGSEEHREKRSRSRRRRKSGGDKGEKAAKSAQPQPQPQPHESAERGRGAQPRGGQKPPQKKRGGEKPPKPEAAQSAPHEKAGEGAGKKKRGHRSSYHRRPKSGGGQKAE